MYDEGRQCLFIKLRGYMNKNKSNAAYTNKWLNRNKSFWHEENYDGYSIIAVTKKDAPKKVLNGVKVINANRYFNFINKKYKNRKIRNKKIFIKPSYEIRDIKTKDFINWKEID